MTITEARCARTSALEFVMAEARVSAAGRRPDAQSVDPVEDEVRLAGFFDRHQPLRANGRDAA
jgi:hypothetical protein